jgi:hypothetical protein
MGAESQGSTARNLALIASLSREVVDLLVGPYISSCKTRQDVIQIFSAKREVPAVSHARLLLLQIPKLRLSC